MALFKVTIKNNNITTGKEKFDIFIRATDFKECEIKANSEILNTFMHLDQDSLKMGIQNAYTRNVIIKQIKQLDGKVIL